jgi:hypothetical protein
MLAAKYSPHQPTHDSSTFNNANLFCFPQFVVCKQVHSLVVSCYINAAVSPRAAVHVVSGRILTNVGDSRWCWGCSWRQQGQIANRQAEVNRACLTTTYVRDVDRIFPNDLAMSLSCRGISSISCYKILELSPCVMRHNTFSTTSSDTD